MNHNGPISPMLAIELVEGKQFVTEEAINTLGPKKKK
jgi:hypothetical protein